MYIGRKQLGQEVALALIVGGSSGIPSWPSSLPLLDIWQGTTLILSGLPMPKIDGGTLGYFQRILFLDERFPLGRYEAVMRYVTGTYRGVKISNFEIVPGGNPQGAIISMFHHDLPQARYLIMQTDAGKLIRGKNPSA